MIDCSILIPDTTYLDLAMFRIASEMFRPGGLSGGSLSVQQNLASAVAACFDHRSHSLIFFWLPRGLLSGNSNASASAIARAVILCFTVVEGSPIGSNSSFSPSTGVLFLSAGCLSRVLSVLLVTPFGCVTSPSVFFRKRAR